MGILQIFDTFFEEVPNDLAPAPGHIYWVPVPDVQEVPLVLEVERATPDEHLISSFEIKQIEKQHFTRRERLPIKKLNLGDTEELFIAKAKKRPTVVLASTTVDDVDSLPDGT